MCGICGELTFDGAPVRAETIVSMRDRLEHRGPDAHGVFVSADSRAGLGFRRLAIIDVSPLGNQPMANEDGSVRLAFNGEIYNFQALRKRLVANGHTFRSHSDTEVLVHLYEDAGPKFVDEIDGMFAIAIWDARASRLVLARDRAGKKPLFVYRDRRRLVFGSEIKAIFAHPYVPIDVDEARVSAYFTYGYVPHPLTFYRGVTQVDPAHVLVVDADGRTETRRYWQLRFPAAGGAVVDRRVARERVRELVTAAVARRLVSDVPLGAFLSAGIDSTVVVGVMSRLMNAPVKTFTIGFEDAPAFDETAAAREIARRFNTEHTEFRVKPSAVELIDRLVWHHDGPFGDSSAIPTFLVSQLTRQHVTVVLTGDGGDELFAGYLRFQAALAAERMPRFARPLAEIGLSILPDAPHERHVLARARRFVKFMHLPLVERLVRWNSIFQDDLTSLLLKDSHVDPLAHVSSAIAASRGASPLNQLLAVNYASYLPDDLLVKTDRCTMANSLEARCPLLDTALTEYAASLPDAFKLDGTRTKAVLRDAFADLIPADIDRRPKTGFGVPLDAWFRGELRDYVRDVLLAPAAASRAFLKVPAVSQLIDRHQQGHANLGHRLWTLVCFERWLQQLRSWTAERQTRYHVSSN